MKAMLLTAIFLASCQAIPEADAQAECRAVFEELKRKSADCGGKVTGTPGSVCERAYSFDDDALERCKAGLAAVACQELDTDRFLELCGKVFYLRTW